MFSRQQAQTGKRVYGGISQAPNRGQVSAAGAQGYIKRELRNKNRSGVLRRIGGDGQSDNRSAVAAQALARQKKGGPIRGRGEGRPITGGKQGDKSGPIRGKDEGRPVVKGGDKSGPFIPENKPKPPPQVTVNPNGVLELPYNQEFSVEQLAAINDANEQLLGLKMAGDQQAQEYGQAKRQSQLAYDSLRGQTLNQNAAQGTAFSSRYGTAVVNNATGFANEIGDLEQQNANFLQNRGLQLSGIQSSLNQQLAALAQQYGNDLNEQAGDLGYGVETPGVPAKGNYPANRKGNPANPKNRKERNRDRNRKRRSKGKK